MYQKEMKKMSQQKQEAKLEAGVRIGEDVKACVKEIHKGVTSTRISSGSVQQSEKI